MKVFISWSGEVSHKVAIVLRDWLPSVLQSIVPYVSSEDIDKGARWSSDIAGELDESSFGILCVTKENVDAPWLNFEAGALGKSVDKSRVCPVLFRIKRSEIIEGPILQFQSTIIEKGDIYKLIKSINSVTGESSIEEQRLEKTFDVWWPELLQSLESIEVKNADGKPIKTDQVEDKTAVLLEEVLELSRVNQKILRDPEVMLPVDYFDYAFKVFMRKRCPWLLEPNSASRIDFLPEAVSDLVVSYREILKSISAMRKENKFDAPRFDELFGLIRRMDRPVRHMSKFVDMRVPRDLIDDMDII